MVAITCGISERTGALIHTKTVLAVHTYISLPNSAWEPCNYFYSTKRKKLVHTSEHRHELHFLAIKYSFAVRKIAFTSNSCPRFYFNSYLF